MKVWTFRHDPSRPLYIECQLDKGTEIHLPHPVDFTKPNDSSLSSSRKE